MNIYISVNENFRRVAMDKIKVWEKPTIMILGVEETRDPGNGSNDQTDWVLCTKHWNHAGIKFAPNTGHQGGIS
jgi:hypothetical protein